MEGWAVTPDEMDAAGSRKAPACGVGGWVLLIVFPLEL